MDVSRLPPHPDRKVVLEEPTVLVGWTHRDLLTGIELRLQSSRSQIALENGALDAVRLCMTRNQALLLARYLLEATGQELPEKPRRRLWPRRREEA